jgi:hypothetical protein
MRLLLILAAAVLVFALIGWISFSRGPDDRASINLETPKIRQDTQHAMQSGAELLHKAGDNVAREANKASNAEPAQQTTTTTTTTTK